MSYVQFNTLKMPAYKYQNAQKELRILKKALCPICFDTVKK